MTIAEIVKKITEQKKILVVRTGPLMFTMNSRALSLPAASTCTSSGAGRGEVRTWKLFFTILKQTTERRF